MCDYCTYSLGGNSLIHQAIYICKTCQSENQCCCLACANNCHEGHDVEFLAFGKAYCDCGSLGPNTCKLINLSLEKAKSILSKWPYHTEESSTNLPKALTFQIDNIPPETWCQIGYACDTLATLSKDTFWIDYNMTPRCLLEDLAKQIYIHHIHLLQSYCTIDMNHSGAEWWIQVKDIHSSSSQSYNSNNNITTNISDINMILNPSSQLSQLSSDNMNDSNDINNINYNYNNSTNVYGIDLHYDKDENIAELFGVGIFPKLSTVTYINTATTLPPPITNSHSNSDSDNNSTLTSSLLLPTLIFDTTASHPVGYPIPSYIHSIPQQGKHLIFDGSLLHGAPICDNINDNNNNHDESERINNINTNITILNHSNQNVTSSSSFLNNNNNNMISITDNNILSQKRITFLVNIWINHHPSGVQILPESIVHTLLSVPSPDMEIQKTISSSSSQMSTTGGMIENTTIDYISSNSTSTSIYNDRIQYYNREYMNMNMNTTCTSDYQQQQQQQLSMNTSSSMSLSHMDTTTTTTTTTPRTNIPLSPHTPHSTTTTTTMTPYNSLYTMLSTTITFQPLPIGTLNVTKKEIIQYDDGWIEVPFVSNKSSWGKDEDEAGLYLSFWRPRILSNNNNNNNNNKKEDTNYTSGNTVNTTKIKKSIGNKPKNKDTIHPDMNSYSTYIVHYPVTMTGASLQYEVDEDDEEEFCMQVTTNTTII